MLQLERFREIVDGYPRKRIAVIGDFCLDRYLEIDPLREEVSIETGLPVFNVSRVRAQPGAAGTVLNNLVALGIGQIDVVGFCGDDGEGYELRRALAQLPNVNLDHFEQTPERRTFTYCKPLMMEADGPPRELNRLDSKNWTTTPETLARRIADSVRVLARDVDLMVVMDQVDLAGTGVVSSYLFAALQSVSGIPLIADSRRSLADYPPVISKMNEEELARLVGRRLGQNIERVSLAAGELAEQNGQAVIVTMADRGMIGALPDRRVVSVAALPTHGPIDIVGAGDAVTANLAGALSCGASLEESLQLASVAASIVIHQVGTTGTATVAQLEECLPSDN